MSNGPEVLIEQLSDKLETAIDQKNIAEIQRTDKKIADLLGHPKLDKRKYEKSLKGLKEVHDKALKLVREESHRVSSSLRSLDSNSEGLRGYFEASGE